MEGPVPLAVWDFGVAEGQNLKPQTEWSGFRTYVGVRKFGVPYFGVLIMRILVFRVLY